MEQHLTESQIAFAQDLIADRFKGTTLCKADIRELATMLQYEQRPAPAQPAHEGG